MKFTLKRERPATSFAVGGTPQVNLLPRAIAEKRERKALLLQWGVRTGAAAAVLVVATVGMLAWQGITAMQLSAAQNEGSGLITQLGTKAEIQQLLDEESELAGFAEASLATALGWRASVDLLLQSFPGDAELCGFDLVAGDAPSGDPLQSLALSGTIEVCGPFRSAAPFLADATAVVGVKRAEDASGKFNTRRGQYQHTIAVEFDQTIYLSVKHDAADEAPEAPAARSTPEEEHAPQQVVAEELTPHPDAPGEDPADAEAAPAPDASTEEANE